MTTNNMPEKTRKLAEQCGLTDRQLEAMENARPPQGAQPAMPAGFIKMAERFGYDEQQIAELAKVREITQHLPPKTAAGSIAVKEAGGEPQRVWTEQEQTDLAILRREICGW